MDPVNQPLLQNRISRILDEFRPDSDSKPSPIAFALIRRVNPVAQNGPQCGLVALHMASTMLQNCTRSDSTIESIFHRAKTLGFTNNGEMFSVQWMADLAKDLYSGCDAKVVEVDNLRESPSSFIIRTLLGSRCLLVPYDTDKNHEPCTNRGHTAHWALIIGFLVIDPHGESSETFESLQWLDPTVDNSEKSLNRLTKSDNRVYIFALHGKSKHAAVWSLDSLLASNRNLHEIGAKRANDGLRYVVPTDGVSGGLRGKVLVLA